MFEVSVCAFAITAVGNEETTTGINLKVLARFGSDCELGVLLEFDIEVLRGVASGRSVAAFADGPVLARFSVRTANLPPLLSSMYTSGVDLLTSMRPNPMVWRKPMEDRNAIRGRLTMEKMKVDLASAEALHNHVSATQLGITNP